MTLQDIASLRLQNQQLSHPTLTTPAEVVSWFGAMQAQDLFASLFAIGRRMSPGATESAIEQTIADKTIARSWPMRGTIHFAPPEDMLWMTKLLAGRIITKAAGNYRRAEITPQELTKAGDVFKNILEGTQLTRHTLYEALNKAGIDTNGRNGEQRGMHFIVHWACRGLLCTAPRQGKQQAFTLLKEWLPNNRGLTGDAAIIELGTRYFASHGPATFKDFSWWTGLTMTEIKPNISAITKQLQKISYNGVDYWHAPRSTAQQMPEVILLTAFDEYTIAYADRGAALDTQYAKQLGYGLAPNILINGKIAGTWRRTIKKDTVIITPTLTTPLTAQQKTGLQKAAANYAGFLGLTAVVK
ncbi:MAG TPA: winged helix DNA-binding domain-containing protein [Magnetospirillaceae bacterium]|nr:winged helix DNA-binding domain-containing protein [Magnetospirillaceae bacterium]